MSEDFQLVSVESPYNAISPWKQLRNIQYAILANTHAASLERDVTWTPHICNTQIVKFGYNAYIGDTFGNIILGTFNQNVCKYWLGRDETLKRTNAIRQSHIDKVVCYTDFGISNGMQSAIDAANSKGVPVEMRKLPLYLKKEIIGQSFASTAIPITKFSLTTGLAWYGFLQLFKKVRVLR